jgi:photosystem II stability/assembly factor-like uncharacterized protein
VPSSFTAVSERDYWVLGSVPCESGRCSAAVATTDGGRSFTTVSVPELQALGTAGVTPTLRFADHEDGWAFVTGSGGAFYATHDGGADWRRLQLGSVVAFASGGGFAYAVTGDCSDQGCSDFHFSRTAVSRDDWTRSAMPFTPDGPVLDLSAHGSNVWLLGTRRTQAPQRYDTLARSNDGGASFTVGDGPCFPGLGGAIEPSSATVLWAVCPTGMMAGAARSADGGLSWTPLHTPGLNNFAQLAPASNTTALLTRNGAGAPPLLTTDAGASWQRVRTPPRASFWPWAGFTDEQVGAAIVQTQRNNQTKIEFQQLWRTTDGGANWSIVRFH